MNSGWDFQIWKLIAIALIFFMQAGFAMCEAGFTRAKNTGNITMKNLMDFCLGMCDEWLDFTRFYRWAMANGYRRELEIDRIDNTRGYSPDNCRWVTHAEQLRNRRMTEKMRAANLRNIAKANAVNAARRAAARKEGSA